MTTTRTYKPSTRAERDRVEKEARHLARQGVEDFAQRVLSRMHKAPRFQSIGKAQYVYVEDVAQIMDEELDAEAGS